MFQIIIAVIIVGSGVLALEYYVKPELEKLTAVQAETEIVNDAIKQIQEVIRLRDELLSRYNSISQADIEKIRQFLPTSSSPSKLLVDVEALSRNAGVTITNITFSEQAGGAARGAPSESPNADVNSFVITVGLTGSYDNFQKFLGLVEHNLRLIDVASVKLQSGEDVKDYQYTVELRAYYQTRLVL